MLPGTTAAANMETTGQPAPPGHSEWVGRRGLSGKAALSLSQGSERLAELCQPWEPKHFQLRARLCARPGCSPASIQLLPTAPKSGAHFHDWMERVEAQSWERLHVAKNRYTQRYHSRAQRKVREFGFLRKREGNPRCSVWQPAPSTLLSKNHRRRKPTRGYQ